MAYPSYTSRGTSLQTADQLVYTYSSLAIGNENTLRAVCCTIAFATLSGAAATTSMISSVTIGGVTATQLGSAAASTFNVCQAVYAAYVPTGTTADIVVTFNTVMTRCYIMWSTFKPSTLTPVDTFSVIGGASTPTDVSLTDIATVNNGLIIVSWLQQNATANTIIWTGSESITTDQALTAIDGTAFYAQQLSIQPTSATTTNDIVISSTGMRRNIVVLSFDVEGKHTDTIVDAVGVAETNVPAYIYSPVYAESAIFTGEGRHTTITSYSDTLDDYVDFSEFLASPQYIEIYDDVVVVSLVGTTTEFSLTDGLGLFDAINIALAFPTTEAFGVSETTLSYYFVRGVVVTDQINPRDTASTNGRYIGVILDRPGVRDKMLISLPAAVSDSMGIAFAQSVIRATGVVERLGLTELVLPSAKYRSTFSDSVGLTDVLLRFFSGSVVEGIGVHEATTYSRVARPTLADTLGVNDTLARKFLLRITAADTVDIDDSQALKLLFKPTLADGIEIVAGYVSPSGNVTTWAINTKNFAATEYTNFNFNSFAQMGNVYLGATDTGLYQLDGDTDAGAAIIADIKSGLMQLGGSRFTSFKAAYLGMRGEGNFVLKLETGDGKFYNYAVVGKDMQTTKVHLGKGLRARYFAFELISTGQDFDLDSIEFIPLVAQRRV